MNELQLTIFIVNIFVIVVLFMFYTIIAEFLRKNIKSLKNKINFLRKKVF